MSIKYVALLQNAWSPMYAGEEWPRRSWLAALHRCPTGRKLALMGLTENNCWFDNTTPIVGATADSVVPPDLAQVRYVLAEQKPKVVIGLGSQAAKCLTPEVWPGRLMVLPHPAYRLISNKFLEGVAMILLADRFTHIKVVPAKGGGTHAIKLSHKPSGATR